MVDLLVGCWVLSLVEMMAVLLVMMTAVRWAAQSDCLLADWSAVQSVATMVGQKADWWADLWVDLLAYLLAVELVDQSVVQWVVLLVAQSVAQTVLLSQRAAHFPLSGLLLVSAWVDPLVALLVNLSQPQ